MEEERQIFNQSLSINPTISQIALEMNLAASDLEVLFPEHTRYNRQLNKQENALFYSIRRDLSRVINATRGHILNNKHTSEDEKIIAECQRIIGLPYRPPYDLRGIVKAAHDYYDLIEHKGLINIVYSRTELTPDARFNKA